MAFQLMLYRVSVYGVSDIGLVRQNNEDCWKQLPEEQFYVLADGMGGHQAGEVASYKCVEDLCSLLKSHFKQGRSLEECKIIIRECIQEVNKSIYYLAKQEPKLRGMGTTLCCMFLHPEGLIYAHVGDSRIYRWRDLKLEQLTADHSLLRELIDLGQLGEQQAEDFLYNNIITKAIGTELTVEPSVGVCSIEAGDQLIMCTDGLSDLLSCSEIEMILSNMPGEEAVKQLVRSAKKKGGYDNITVVLVKVKNKYAPNLS